MYGAVQYQKRDIFRISLPEVDISESVNTKSELYRMYNIERVISADPNAFVVQEMNMDTC